MNIDEVVQAVRDGSAVEFDGVMSPTSRAIQARLGDQPIDMNVHWVWTAQAWTCPSCERPKVDLARTGQQGQIVARLVIHHDHAGDLVQQEFAAAFLERRITAPQVEGKMLVDRLHGAFAAHEEVLVCEDCNNADAAAKKLAGTPTGFSFTPRQIRAFIRPRPNAPHLLDDPAVHAQWQRAQPLYELRRDLIQRIAGAAAAGEHWFEQFDGKGRAVPSFLESLEGRGLQQLGADALKAALAPKVAFKRDMGRWRVKDSPRRAAPPANAEALMCSVAVHAKSWEETGATWKCPCCVRPRTAVLYMNQGKALPGVGRVGHRAAFGRALRLCADCNTLLDAIREEAKQYAHADPRDGVAWLQVDELRSLIRHCEPHQAHAVDGPHAAVLVEVVADRFRKNGTPRP